MVNELEGTGRRRPQEEAQVSNAVGRRNRRAIGVLLGLGCLLAAGDAWAISGELADSVGIFRVSGASCDPIRTRTGVQGDVFFSCDPNGEACDIDLPDTDRETRSGIAATAFCADTFPAEAASTGSPGIIKPSVTIVGSTFSGITGVKPPGDPLNEATSIVCSTFSLPSSFDGGGGVQSGPGVRVCRKVSPGACTGSFCPPTCAGEQANYFVTQSDSCADIASLINGAVGQSPTLAWALFTDINPAAPGSVGEPGRQALLVCPGYRWECVNETNRQELGSVIDYRVPLGAVQERPDCYVTTKGYRYPRPPC